MTKFNYADAMKTAAIAASLVLVSLGAIWGAELDGLTQKQKDAKLVRACSSDDVEKVADLLRAGANPNADLGPDDYEDTPLCAAVSNSKVETVKLLLKAGANPNQVDSTGWPPLFHLRVHIFGGDSFEELLQLLIQAGADVNVTTPSGEVLIGQIAGQDVEQAKVLLKSGAKPHISILEETARRGNRQSFDWGLSLGLDPKHLGPEGRTLFHFTAEYYYGNRPASERAKFWERLLEVGVNPLKIDADGFSPLHLAAQSFNAALIEWLIDHKAAVNARTRTGSTPLILTMSGGDFAEIALPLIHAGAALDAKDNGGKDALAHAREAKNWSMVTGLLTEEAKIDKPGELALEAAKTAAELEITSGRLFSILSPILSTGLNPNVQDTNGTPLLTWAARAGSEEAVKLLIEKGADVNTLDGRGRTALMWAEMIRCEPVKQALMTAGAKTSLRDLDGRTAADFATLTDPTLSEPLMGISDGKPAPLLGDPRDGGIFGAIQRNDVQSVLRLLKSDPKQIDSNRGEITPLSLASALGRIEVMKLLLKLRAKEETKEPFGFTPIHQAIMNHQAEAMILLLRSADPKDVEAATERTFSLIDERKNSRLASRLIEAGYSPGEFGRSLLSTAAQAGDLKLCGQLLDLGIPVINPSGEIHYPEGAAIPFGQVINPLEAAARQTDEKVMRLFLQHLEHVSKPQKRDSLISALQAASYRGNAEMIQLLIEEAHVDPNAGATPDPKGSLRRASPLLGKPDIDASPTALSLAVDSGNIEAVKYLIKRGASIEAANQAGYPPLVSAIRRNIPELIELFFNLKVDVNAPDHNHRTPLHCAAERGDLELVKRLVNAGADRNAKDVQSQRPSSIARQHSFDAVADWLETAPPNIKGSPSQKP